MSFKFFNSGGQELNVNSVADLPIGTIVDYGADTPPLGWLKCDGTAVSRADYADLFGVLGTFYGTGNGTTTFNLPDISGSIVYALTNSRRILSTSPPQFVSTLPASPISGQEIYYQASGVMAASGITWHLRYNASSSSAYKWEFVGGAKMTSFDLGSAGPIGVDSWVSINANDPSLTVPLTGEYVIENFANMTINGSPISVWIGVRFGNTNPGINDDGLVSIGTITTSGYWHSLFATSRRTISANDATSRTIGQRYYQSSGSSWTISRRSAGITAIPVRVG